MCLLIYVGVCWVRFVMSSGIGEWVVGSIFRLGGRCLCVLLCSSVIWLWKFVLCDVKLWLNSGYLIGWLLFVMLSSRCLLFSFWIVVVDFSVSSGLCSGSMMVVVLSRMLCVMLVR